MKNILKSLISLNPASITTFCILFVLVIFVIGIPFLDFMEYKAFDLRFLSRGILKPSPAVVLAVIDEKSLDAEGRWPWPRATIGRLINTLSRNGAKVISFDIGFLEADQNTNVSFIEQFESKIDKLEIKDNRLKGFINESKIKADNDLGLASAIKKSKAKVILGYFFHMGEEGLDSKLNPEAIKNQMARISNSRYQLIQYEDQDMDFDPFFNAYVPEGNIEVLSEAADGSGYFNMLPDEDGVVRRLPLMIKCRPDKDEEGEVYAPLSIHSVWHYLDNPQMIVKVASYGITGIQLGKKFIPTDENGQMLINYLGPQKIFPHYSISDILEEKLPKGTFENKIVLVGATAIGIYDMRNTPFDAVYPGMEIHATAIDNILTENFLHKPKWTQVFDILAILIMGILIGIVIPRSGALKAIFFAFALFALHIVISHWLFTHFKFWINIVYPLLTLLITYTSLTVYHYLVEEKNKRFLHATFTSYLSPELIEEMVNTETMPELGGEARIVTAYFTDIQGFSTFSEILTAHQLVELLNEYLTAMTDILILERGTLDKYEGDAIIAFMGAPMKIPDHALRACKVGVAMQNALLELREKWRGETQLPDGPNRNIKNLPPDIWEPEGKWPKVVHGMKMRIGINTGEIVVGNMGSAMRMNYTMMGDAVNLAARLEEGAKQFGIYTAVSEYTLNSEYVDENGEQKKVMDAVEARLIDNITVVGKSEPVKVYELCAMKGDLTDKEKELFDLFDNGMKNYANMEWNAAIEQFQEALKIERIPDSKITPSEVFINRCEAFKESPPVAPGEKWDGVYRMTKK